MSEGNDMQNDVERIARDAGDLALSYFGRQTEGFVESKGHLDLVTEADRAVERFILDELETLFPDDGILGEEGSSRKGTSGRTWVIDPIDGTANFVRKSDLWAVSIGLFENDHPIFGVTHAPVRKQTLVGGAGYSARMNGKPIAPLREFVPAMGLVGVGFHPIIPVADRLQALGVLMDDVKLDIRISGAATISLMDVAMGQADGYIGSGISSWDVMAMLAVLETLGAKCNIDWRQAGLSSRLRLICGTPTFFANVPQDILSPAMKRG
jgi:myo-inositol-1(or 4)-monophosphatase